MKLVILDRDGVINHDSDAYIKTPDEWRPIPGSIEAIARLSKAGLRVAVATNQSAIARGLLEPPTLAAIHSRMQRAVQDAGGRIDAVFFCPHGPDDGCDCRKPRPGMVLEILRRDRVPLSVVEPWVRRLESGARARAANGADPYAATGNAQAVLRALYLQLTISPRHPAIRSDLLLSLVASLRRVHPAFLA